MEGYIICHNFVEPKAFVETLLPIMYRFFCRSFASSGGHAKLLQKIITSIKIESSGRSTKIPVLIYLTATAVYIGSYLFTILYGTQVPVLNL
eukprot:SAG31_NODE_8534_length_1434_cov_6.607958_2_plen_92_part_00